MRQKIAGVIVLLVTAGSALDCGSKPEAAKGASADSAASEASRRDHEISISGLKVTTLAPGSEYEITVDVQDAKGDLKPDDKAVAKYQIVCPGGTAHAVLSEPAHVTVDGGRTIVRHRINLGQVKKGSEPCRLRLAVGHRYDFLSNELETALPK